LSDNFFELVSGNNSRLNSPDFAIFKIYFSFSSTFFTSSTSYSIIKLPDYASLTFKVVPDFIMFGLNLSYNKSTFKNPDTTIFTSGSSCYSSFSYEGVTFNP